MSGEIKIVQGSALDLKLRDNSVDLVVTSPPYFGLRSYKDNGEHYEGQIGSEATPAEFVDALIAATREMVRVLKPSGSIWVNLGDKYSGYNHGSGKGRSLTGTTRSDARMRDLTAEANPNTYGAPAKSLIGIPWRYAIRCIDDLGLILRAEVIWSKTNGMPESVTDRVRRSHETWFHFTKEPRYFSAVDEIREEHKPGQSPAALSFNREGRGTSPGQSVAPHRLGREDQGLNPLGKLPGSVWTIPTQPLRVPDHISHARCCGGVKRDGCKDGINHFAAFPMEWPKRIIKGWCPPGGIVLDPFGGTGTTALVASVLGMRAISVDLSGDYCSIARWRTTDPKQIKRARR